MGISVGIVCIDRLGIVAVAVAVCIVVGEAAPLRYFATGCPPPHRPIGLGGA